MGLGSAHTYKRFPVKLVYSEPHSAQLAAIRRERQLKGRSREKEVALIRGDLDLLRGLSKRRN